jgi:hypothetical protein
MKYAHHLHIRISDKDQQHITYLRQILESSDDSQAVRDVLKVMYMYVKRDDPMMKNFLAVYKELLQ